LTALERGARQRHDQPLLANLLGESTIGWPLAAKTRASLLKELVTLAEQSWQVYDPDALLQEIRQREEFGSTALDNGVAIPHPRRRMPATVLGDSVVALGYAPCGLSFGAANNGPTRPILPRRLLRPSHSPRRFSRAFPGCFSALIF